MIRSPDEHFRLTMVGEYLGEKDLIPDFLEWAERKGYL